MNSAFTIVKDISQLIETLNAVKTKIMLITKDEKKKKDFKIVINNEEIKHSRKLKVVGNTINDCLNWNNMLTVGVDSLVNQLKARNHQLKFITKYLDKDMKKKVVNSVFKGKLLFGIEQWGGGTKENLNKVESELKKAAKLALGKEFSNKSDRQRFNQLKWMTLGNEITFANQQATHKILNRKIPEGMSSLMPMNSNH